MGFTDPAAVLAWGLENDPDLLIVGFTMQGTNGTQLTRQFRVRYPDTPVILPAISGYLLNSKN